MNRRLCDAAILHNIIDYGMTGKPALNKYRLAGKLTPPSKSTNNIFKKRSPRKSKAIQEKIKDVLSRVEV